MDQLKDTIYREIMELPENKSLVEYASKFIKLSKEGTRYIGRCPFCNRENRLTVFEDSNTFCCYFCYKRDTINDFRNLLLELFEFRIENARSLGINFTIKIEKDQLLARKRIIRHLLGQG